MSRVRFWVAIGVVALVAGALGLSGVMAQRFQPMAMPVIPFGEVGRYQIVSHGADGIILLDTTNGELYRAKPEDIKPYSARPRPQRDVPLKLDNRRGGPQTDKDKDGRPDRDKDREKKDGDRKDEKKSDDRPKFEERKDGPSKEEKAAPMDQDGFFGPKRPDEAALKASVERQAVIVSCAKNLPFAEKALAHYQKVLDEEKDPAKRKQLLSEFEQWQKYTDGLRAALRMADKKDERKKDGDRKDEKKSKQTALPAGADRMFRIARAERNLVEWKAELSATEQILKVETDAARCRELARYVEWLKPVVRNAEEQLAAAKE
jgi:hypothetical protein